MSSSLLDLEPSGTLVFNSAGGAQSKATLTLRNNQGQFVHFKIKTTAPKRYSVRPNSGRVDPGSSQTVEIAMPQSSDASQIGKDKFLVETVIADANARPDDLWKVDKSQIGQTKLRCQLAESQGDAAAPMGTAPSARQAPVHAPYSGRLSSATLQPISPKPTSAEEESELARVTKINHQLKEQNAKLEEELAGMGDGLRHRRSSGAGRAPVRDFAAPNFKPQKQSPLPALIVALLIGWFIGHFLQFP